MTLHRWEGLSVSSLWSPSSSSLEPWSTGFYHHWWSFCPQILWWWKQGRENLWQLHELGWIELYGVCLFVCCIVLCVNLFIKISVWLFVYLLNFFVWLYVHLFLIFVVVWLFVVRVAFNCIETVGYSIVWLIRIDCCCYILTKWKM